MTKYLLAGTAMALLLPAAAFAQDGTVNINGSVAAKCVIASSATITLNELADADGLYNLAADGKSATLNAWCNGAASTISVVATAITLQGGPAVQPGFTDAIQYTATASVAPAAGGSVSVTDSTVAAAAPAATVGLFSNNITVALSASGTNGGKLIAGSYTGNVVVTLAPAA
ncbi:hypothetical protein [Brevundimonas sp. Root1423]|uniref:hypothetical protein n=1 Tax=Brevundimonas sp. Root1423 TaxID=1736462 RepID=UPI0006F7E9C5|nr:hypothetical protein [Brevundimonas sp. Root1423]KQY75387.1 hypothetical protein ASD25_12695 [Brevundimonas sp. Root1423]